MLIDGSELLIDGSELLIDGSELLELFGVVGVVRSCWSCSELLELFGVVGVVRSCWSCSELLELLIDSPKFGVVSPILKNIPICKQAA